VTPLSKRLRDQALSLRRTSAPLSYLIPLLQQAADALDKRHTGLTPIGWIMESATEGELAAYDSGCNEMMTGLARILDGKDDGAGVANQPWEGLRRRVLGLVEDAELGRTAMRFVDRAGDVAPGIDDAETICDEFHKAMAEVVERWHPMMRGPASRKADGAG
jgi:hypothetical protein